MHTTGCLLSECNNRICIIRFQSRRKDSNAVLRIIFQVFWSNGKQKILWESNLHVNILSIISDLYKTQCEYYEEISVQFWICSYVNSLDYSSNHWMQNQLGLLGKGQLILKCLLGVFNFFRKTNKNTSHSSKNEFFVHFWKNLRLDNLLSKLTDF